MGALDLPGSRPVVAGGAATVLRVDCQRVPATLRAEASVPCLGALDAAALLELRAQAGERPIELADRGWCGSCPAGGVEHPVQTALKSAQALLAEMQVPSALWPRLVNMPLSASAASPGIAGVGGEEAMSRRAFFGRVTRPVRQLAVEPAPDSPIRSVAAAAAHPSLSRQSLVASLSALAARRDQPLPASPYPRITASVRCHDHQGCVRVCPTGALRAYREGDAGGVRFDPAACIACGLCERHCPEQALTLSPPGAAHPADSVHAMVFTQVTELTRHARQECSACGSAYGVSPGATDTGLCDPCGKSRRLARDMFQQFFGARP
jgi:ferredoxin